MATEYNPRIVTDNLIFCVDAANTKSYTPSSPPTTWTAASASEANEWQTIGYGNGKFVAVAKTGTNRIMYSSDGISWTAQAATSASSWRSITYGNGKFVVVGGAGVMYASDSDLTSWTESTMSESNSWRGIAYGNGKFVAVSSNGTNRVGYASDSNLTSWTAASAAEANAWRSVTYGNGKFVAVAAGGTNRVMYASDSDVTSWTAVSAAEDNSWRSVTYGNGKFVAVSATGTNRVMYSSDGINWSNSGLSGVTENSWRSVTYGNGMFVAVSTTNVVIYSSDGINWTTASATEANSWLGITYGNGKFVAVSEDGTNRVMYSTYSYSTNWSDLSGNGNNGTLVDSPTHTSDNGGTFNFNGTASYVELSGTSSLNYPITSSVTLSVFVKFDAVGSWTGLFNKNRSTNTQLGLWLSSSSESNVAVFGADSSNLEGSTTLTTGTWYNIVGVQLADTSRKLYINGVLDGTKTSSFGTTPAGTENWMLGQATGQTEFLDGQIANATIYNKALTAAEVKQNFNAQKARYGL